MSTKFLTKFLILGVLSNKIGTLQCLVTHALDDGLHELDIPQFCLCEKSIDFIYLRKEKVDRVVASRLANNCLTNINQITSLGNVPWADLGSQRKDGPCSLRIRVDLCMG